MSYTKRSLLKEIADDVAKEDEQIKKLKEDISSAMFLKSTVTGGPFADTARRGCDKDAQEARKKIEYIEKKSKWKRDMLAKYK